jgi:hypothetical protein
VLDFLFEGFAVVFEFFGSNVSTWTEYVTVSPNLIELRRFAESRNIRVFACALITTP